MFVRDILNHSPNGGPEMNLEKLLPSSVSSWWPSYVESGLPGHAGSLRTAEASAGVLSSFCAVLRF